MDGKRIVVTGANSGVGLETSRALARQGHRVVMACRDAGRADAARQDILETVPEADLEVHDLDLADLASIDAFAAGMGSIDVLVNNAGLYSPRRRTTADGFELTFGVNHLGTFALTQRMLPRLREHGRVVTVASRAHRLGRLRFDDLHRERRPYVGWFAYADSKLANILFARALAQRMGDRIDSNSLHPGVSVTNIFASAPALVRGILRPFADSAADIARTSVLLASSPEVAGVTGGYWQDEAPRTPWRRARDDTLAQRLWSVSVEATGLG